MGQDGLAPVGVVLGEPAPLRDPGHALAEQREEHELAVEEHVDRREQRRGRRFQQRAGHEARRPAEGRRELAVAQRDDHAERLRQEEQQHGEGKQRERLGHLDGVAEDGGVGLGQRGEAAARDHAGRR